LAGGGKLILSHESGLDVEGKQFVMEEMGVEYLGPSPYQGDYGDYFEVQDGANEDIDRMVLFTYVPGSMVKAGPQSTELARIWKAYFDRTYEHFSSHHQTPFDQPTDQAAVVERGSILYISFPIFESYADNAYRIHKMLVRNCLRRLLPQPLIKAEIPSTAEATVTGQNGKRIVHLLNYPAIRRARDLDIVEEAAPLANLKIALRTAKAPSRVYLAPQRKSLKFEVNDGYTQVIVSSLQGHQMVVFEN
jgi:hypothetical protein